MEKVRMYIMAAVAVLAAATIVYAQPGMGGKGSGGWGTGTQYHRMYNVATVETLKGTIESVRQITPMRGMRQGVHVILKTDKETIPVHLGPSWYMERLDIKLEKGDAVEVKGSRITFNNNPAVIAAEIRKGDKLLKLRDDNGFPVWAGWRRTQ